MNPQGLYQDQQFEPQQYLLKVLTNLSEKLSNLQFPGCTYQQIIIRLLHKIDSNYFQYKFSLHQTYDYEAITKSIVDYYNDRKFQRIKKLFLLEGSYVHRFAHIFKLVLDLAFTVNEDEKNRYLEIIINMDEIQKQLLMPYVEQVMKRKFVSELNSFEKYTDIKQIQHNEQDQLLQLKDQEYQQLKELYQQLSRNYNELSDNHNNLKISYDKLLKENSQTVQQKIQLMNELGVHSSASFYDISEKYKKDMKDMQRQFERLNKQIEDRNNKLKLKQIQIKRLSAIQNNLGTWSLQKQGLIQRNKKIDEELKSVERKQQTLREDMEKMKEANAKLREDLDKKDIEIVDLTRIKNKYKGMKEYHLGFKKNFKQRMKQ